jgi:hypothetical protein
MAVAAASTLSAYAQRRSPRSRSTVRLPGMTTWTDGYSGRPLASHRASPARPSA